MYTCIFVRSVFQYIITRERNYSVGERKKGKEKLLINTHRYELFFHVSCVQEIERRSSRAFETNDSDDSLTREGARERVRERRGGSLETSSRGWRAEGRWGRWWWQFSFWLLFPIISGVKPRRQGGGKVVEEHAPVKGKLRRRF